MELDVRLLREFSGLNQTDFWDSVGITQSGGSRYESGERRLPKPVQHLLRLVYIEKIDLEQVKRRDMDVLSYLKREQTDLYKKLVRESATYYRQNR
jgi:transcriptional regulator with XRE-family HTH domain